nr:PREDICTED: exosome complex component CSL4 [Latimeria chalumnae]|eukprot:XP_014343174.1 PREDICTED: exosome complex component CSL4 [Latimeria chalumnae]
MVSRLPVISVVRESDSQLLPDVGAVVTCKVRSPTCEVHNVQELLCGGGVVFFFCCFFFFGLKRVSAICFLQVEVYKCFRPGDIVLAKVISLGDAQSNYLLATTENELGVVVAHSEAGLQMVPISWCEMQCPRTHTKEFRKVARVQPEYLQT